MKHLLLSREQLIRLLGIGGAVAVLDQLTKWIILKSLALYQIIEVIPGFFNIVYFQNPGGAFGFLAGQSPSVRKLVFLFISSLAVCLVYYFYKNVPKTHPWLAAALALIFGGAIGNLIDRFRMGKVVDFLDFYVGNMHWPAFNVADSAITVGVAIIILHIVTDKMPEDGSVF